MFKSRRSNLFGRLLDLLQAGGLAAAAGQQPDEPLDRSGWLGSTHLNSPAGKGGHLDLLARLDAKMPQQLLPQRDLALGPTPLRVPYSCCSCRFCIAIDGALKGDKTRRQQRHWGHGNRRQ
jgi:hypothetical protein